MADLKLCSAISEIIADYRVGEVPSPAPELIPGTQLIISGRNTPAGQSPFDSGQETENTLIQKKPTDPFIVNLQEVDRLIKMTPKPYG